MNSLLAVGKYLDQPRLVGNFAKSVPTILVAGGSAFAINQVHATPKKEKRNEFIKTVSVLTFTIGSVLLATRGMGKIKVGQKVLFKGFEGLSKSINLKELEEKNTALVDTFLKKNKVSKKAAGILQKIKTKILSYGEIKDMFSELEQQKNGRNLLAKLIPDPENIDSKNIFGEIKRLSLIGLIPVLGGISGGILGDKLTEKNWKEKIPNKIKEGSYQYMANIFLCNIGAGAALAMLEKAKITSKAARGIGMTIGIFAVGVFGGSALANLFGSLFIDPIVDCKLFRGKNESVEKLKFSAHKNRHRKFTELCSERKPEAIDVGLHADDIATVAVLSGLKWIEPALPLMYSVSGYKAGIGYRNNNSDK